MKHSNRLIHETSPYLLQHAHNPVNWYPWCEEALEKAKKENKLILVSIGYSSCHWCHVMEKESFEDEPTALLMNQYYVSIKIDREERPDLDHFFMDALQAISGNGGWPLNMFLTPDGKPFYGGTYFPPVSMYNRISWKELLVQLHDAFLKRPDDIESQANNLLEHLEKSNQFKPTQLLNIELQKEERFTEQQSHQIFHELMKAADREEGGFGNAPKFPQTYSIQLLLRYHHFFQSKDALDQALLSLKKMIRGGIYDQIGGGFCRYSTDSKWLVPHFEKMLYDNALLITTLTEAYQITRDDEIKQAVVETVEFLKREMFSNEGFYAALDADSEGIEGKYYVWNKDEFDEVLGGDADLMGEFFNVEKNGNWEHTNILHIKQSWTQWAVEKGLLKEDASLLLAKTKGKLLHSRAKRERPGLDDKIILGWNALICSAISQASIVFEKEEWRDIAVRNMQFLLQTFQKENGLSWRHTFKDDQAKFHAFLDDLAYLTQSCIYLHESTGQLNFLDRAKEITDYIISHFSDAQGIYFYFSPAFQKDVLVRKIDLYDGAVPSGNSIMAWNLYRLGILFDKAEWIHRAQNMLKGVLEPLVHYPTSFGKWGILLMEIVQGIKELAVMGKSSDNDARKLLKTFLPNKIVIIGKESTDTYPLLMHRPAGEKTHFFICQQYSCDAPVEDPTEAVVLLLTKS